jgi:hypothetical protein
VQRLSRRIRRPVEVAVAPDPRRRGVAKVDDRGLVEIGGVVDKVAEVGQSRRHARTAVIASIPAVTMCGGQYTAARETVRARRPRSIGAAPYRGRA